MQAFHVVFASGLLLIYTLVQAAYAVASRAANDPLATALQYMSNNRWTDAILELERMNLRGNADWNSLMGYSLHKARAPDLVAAENYYDSALIINPNHRRALSFSGELYLLKGELSKAEERLAALDKCCLFPCAEYTDLKKSIELYKANCD